MSSSVRVLSTTVAVCHLGVIDERAGGVAAAPKEQLVADHAELGVEDRLASDEGGWHSGDVRAALFGSFVRVWPSPM
jgi:hypothetical protein